MRTEVKGSIDGARTVRAGRGLEHPAPGRGGRSRPPTFRLGRDRTVVESHATPRHRECTRGRVRRSHAPTAVGAEIVVRIKVACATAIGTTGHRILPRQEICPVQKAEAGRRYSEIATNPTTEQPAGTTYGQWHRFGSNCRKFSTTTTLRPCREGLAKLLRR